MQKSLFKPWIGSKFIDEGLYGLKLLFLGEAHYGKAGEEHENTTIDTVRYYSRHKHRYFTTTAKIGLLKGAGDLNDHLPKLPSSVKTCKVNHPSMAFSYSKWLPAVREALLGVGAALPQDK